jgi:hypothetical protein
VCSSNNLEDTFTHASHDRGFQNLLRWDKIRVEVYYRYSYLFPDAESSNELLGLA